MRIDEITVKLWTKKRASQITERELQVISDEYEIANLEVEIHKFVLKTLQDYHLDNDLDFQVNS